MIYELDSTMYNGKRIQPQTEWETNLNKYDDVEYNIKNEPTPIFTPWLKIFCCRIKILWNF
mgnify:CR=1 FL=1